MTRMDRWRNEEVRQRVGVREETSDIMGWNVLNWFGHVEHTSGERLAKRAYMSKVEGGKYKGKPYMRWLDEVGKACNARSLQLRDAKVKCSGGTL